LFTWTAGVITTVVALLAAPASNQPKPANGLPLEAQVTGQWVLSRSDREPIGILTHAVACPARVYLLALVRKTIYTVDLKQPSLGIALGPEALGTVAKNPGEIMNMFVDCRTGQLSVVVNLFNKNRSKFIATFDPGSRHVIRTFELPPEFSPGINGIPQLDAVNRRVLLPGIWPAARNGWLAKPVGQALTDTAFGLILSLDNGQASKLLMRGVDAGCRAWVGHCLESFFAQNQPDEWVFAHGLSTQLSVIRSGKTVSTLDMRSPMFKFVPGDSVARPAPREQGVAWAYRNSEIRGLFIIDRDIVVAHAHHRTEHAKAGGWVDFTAYLNVFNQKGDRVHSDLRLSGLPIGAASDAVWVASYRPERNDQARELVLQKVSPRPSQPR
jgi:hypothetical protein